MKRSGQDVTIVGAGLVGSLLAIMLKRRGYQVDVYERAPDIRSAQARGGRSINLILTARGVHALHRVGLHESVLALTVPVTGRMIHDLDGNLSYQPYGKDETECNYSISRAGLNRFLISRAEQEGVRFRFEAGLESVDLDRGRLGLSDGTEVDAPVLFGADGAGSPLRAALMQRAGAVESAELIEYGYRELLIPVEQGKQIEERALHIWPRGDSMLMALPNLDRSFTVTLYLPVEGPQSFSALRSQDEVRALFTGKFPDAMPLIPDLDTALLANPTGHLGTVKCAPWHLEGKAALIGDAAHAIVPFFGQGMNCGFEDCSVLDDLLDQRGPGDWEQIFPAYDAARKIHADAIADMALDNFVEMRDRVGDARFLLRKAVEHELEQAMPDEYRSRYSMVVYSLIPYAVAMEAGNIQAEILDEICRDLDDAAEVDLVRARLLIRQKLTPFLVSHKVDLGY